MIAGRLGRLRAGSVLRHRPVRDYAYMTVGLALTAWALVAFLIPNKLAAGGVSGLATIIFHVAAERGISAPVGVQMLIMNSILLAIGVRFRGLHYAAKTIYGIVGLSLFVEVFARMTPALATDDLLLAALYGGAVSGVGMGMVFKAGGNTGGTDIVAQLLARRISLGVGQLLLAVDALVVLLAAFIFGPQFALYAVVAIFVSGSTIDLVLEGLKVEKAVFIISDAAPRIAEAITGELGRGATHVTATGAYTGEQRGMLFVVVSRREIDDVKAIVRALDSTAMVVISDVHETLGEGFKEMGV
jgi:uncharacterized membrane-anchored protein YitT (DUF2179 family)